MPSQFRSLLIAVAGTICLLLGASPQTALADGPVTPVATNYLARVSTTPAGIEARVADGYLTLWVRAAPRVTVVVKDFQGAPWVRFAPGGVWINRNSEAYYLSQVPTPETPPRNLTARTPPRWQKVSGGHSYAWREGRMHALADVALPAGQTYAGQWRIPLTVDGHTAAITGGVWRSSSPSVVWFWPIAVILLCLLAALRLRSAAVDTRIRATLSWVLLGCIALAFVARGLHGRPLVSEGQIVLLAIELGIVFLAAAGLARAGRRHPAALPAVIALVSIWFGLTMLTSLTHAYVLTALPAFLVRAATVVMLGGGIGLVPFVLRATGTRSAAALAAATLIAGCGSSGHPQAASAKLRRAGDGIPQSLLAAERPIGRGSRFRPAARGPVPGECRPTLGRREQAHVELFGDDRVVLLAAGIGTSGPRHSVDGRITKAGCFGSLVTLDQTGTVYVRRGSRPTVGTLFRAWGQPLTRSRIASFTGSKVQAYVNGRARRGPVNAIPLTDGAEIVLEVGPHVPPHSRFVFPPKPASDLG